MKRLALLVLALAILAPSTTASAAVPCRVKIYNDWLTDGKIATTYPIACYRDALKNVHTDAAIYSSLKDDIRAAMQGALARRNGHTSVPAQIGKGGRSAVKAKTVKLKKPTRSPKTTTVEPASQTLTSTTASGPSESSGSGVPTPILVLGALALLLVAIGTVGAAARRTRRR